MKADATSPQVAELVERICALPRPLLVALDVDGTLAPIVEDPEASRVPAPLARSLGVLAAARGVRLALVTGRDARSLGHVVRVPGAWRAVEHGRRVLRPGERARVPRLAPDVRRRLERFAAWAEREAVPEGARLERKAAAVAVHVRGLAERSQADADAVLRAAEREARRLGLACREGRAVREVEAEPGDKGEALARLVGATRARGVIYAGDDVTDYPAIRRAAELGGEGLFVRSKERPRAPRSATVSVTNGAELALLLAALADRLG